MMVVDFIFLMLSLLIFWHCWTRVINAMGLKDGG